MTYNKEDKMSILEALRSICNNCKKKMAINKELARFIYCDTDSIYIKIKENNVITNGGE